MKFPDRPGGAPGSLIRANEFDRNDGLPFSKTRHGDNIIHKRNGDLVITRDVVETHGIPPLWVRVPRGTGSLHSRPPYEIATEDQQDQTETNFLAPGSTSTVDWEESDNVYVGDGYVLGLLHNKNSPRFRAWPALWAVDNLNGESVYSLAPGTKAGKNIRYDDAVDWLPFVEQGGGLIRPIVFASGKDADGAYWFGIFGIDHNASDSYDMKYTCYVGNTRDLILQKVALPSLPDSPIPLSTGVGRSTNKQGWWGEEVLAPGRTDENKGPALCFCVGPGHLIAILQAHERIELGREEGVPFYGTDEGLLPVGSAPYILRSRDHGKTWLMERATWMNDNIATVTIERSDLVSGATVPYSIECQASRGWNRWTATPFGGGRIALFYPGDALVTHEVIPDSFGARNTWLLYISDANGQNFERRPWPGDQLRLTRDPLASVDQEIPQLESPWATIGMQSAGPGSLFAMTAIIPTGPDPIYPDQYPRFMHSTSDGAATWGCQLIPLEVAPFAASWMLYRDETTDPAAYPALGSPWCVVEAATETRPAEIWVASGEYIPVFNLWRTNSRFDEWENMLTSGNRMFYDPKLSPPLRLLYVGAWDQSYPEKMHAGYPEFDGDTP